MESLGYEIIGIVLAIIVAALIWSVANMWEENRPQNSDTRSARRKKI
jgi:hypothetical protein